jgi:hypothetical protein
MSTPGQAPSPQPNEILMQLTTGYMVSAALYAAAKLGIADLLTEDAKSVQQLAAATNTNEDALYRMLRALASVGVFMEMSPRTFALTPVAQGLRSDQDGSLRDLVLWLADPFHFRTYAEMPHAVKTGETVVEKVFAVSCFEYLEKDKETGEAFNVAMTNFTKVRISQLLDAYDFSWLKGKTLVDIGGGHGHLLTAILAKYPEIRGVIFDLQHVLSGTKLHLANAGLSGRCETHGGDFFVEVPPADAYLMKHVIHDWSDDKALTILKNCHRAGRGDCKVILLEAVLTPGNDPGFAKWLDLEMLLLPGGRERTEEEFATLFDRAGFTLQPLVDTKSPVRVLEARKPA